MEGRKESGSDYGQNKRKEGSMMKRGIRLTDRIWAWVLAILMVVMAVPMHSVAGSASSITSYVVTVTAESGGSPVEGATVTIHEVVDGVTQGTIIKSVDTDAAGKADFSDVEWNGSMTYAYKVTKVGYSDKSGPVDLTSGDNVSLIAKSTCTVIGTVTTSVDGSRVPLSDVEIIISGYTELAPVKTDSSGNFSVSGVYEGEEYTITASLATYKINTENNLSFNSSSNTHDIVLEKKATDTLTFQEAGPVTIGYGQSYVNTASAVSGETGISYSSSAEDIVTVATSGAVTAVGIGTTTITAIKAESDDYLECAASYGITVEKGSQGDLSWSAVLPDPVKVTWSPDGFCQYTASGGIGDGAITYTSSAISIATVSNEEGEEGKVTFIKPGNATITAIKSGGALYNDASVSYNLTINKAEQKIQFTKPSYNLTMGNYFETSPSVTVTKTDHATGAITYSVESDSSSVIESINASTGAIKFTGNPGTATILATKAEDDYYTEATEEYSVTVSYWNPEGEAAIYYTLTGTQEDAASGWFTGNVNITAKEGYKVSDNWLGTNGWKDSLDSEVEDDTQGTDKVFYLKEDKEGGRIACFTANIKRDTVPPEAAVKFTKTGGSAWSKLLTFISFGFLGIDEAEFEIIGTDTNLKSIEYYISDETTELTSGELAAVSGWSDYDATSKVTINSEKKCVVYAKVTDLAGNVSYANTKGLIVDNTAPEVTFTPLVEATPNGYYDGDVSLQVEVNENKIASGIKKISYQIFDCKIEDIDTFSPASGTITLYSYDKTDPKETELVTSWDSDTADTGGGKHNISVDASAHNFDNVTVVVTAEDNAGNIQKGYYALSICINTPQLQVEYKDAEGQGYNPVYQDTENKVDYYNETRCAEITIISRPSLFDEKGITIAVSAKDAGGNEVENAYTLGEWAQKEGDKGDNTTYTAVISFTGNAIYTWEISYVNGMDKQAVYTDGESHTKYESETFVVDYGENGKPDGLITMNQKDWWVKIGEVLSFGLWSNNEINVCVSGSDMVSPIKEIAYYEVLGDAAKTSNLSEADLKQTGIIWTPVYTAESGGTTDNIWIKTLSADQIALYYVRITDYAENVYYIRSNGAVLDKAAPNVTVTVDTIASGIHKEEGDEIPVYNKDVTLVVDAEDSVPYSGIKTVSYKIYCDEKVTKSETIYSFEETLPAYGELTEAWNSETAKKNIVVKAADNNSCNVKVVVTVVDNAGNEKTAEQILDIDITKPALMISYDNNTPFQIKDGRGYYAADRTATLTFTERSAHFSKDSALEGIMISAVNAKNEAAIGEGAALTLEEMLESEMIDETEWVSVAAGSGVEANRDKHSIKIHYHTDANYTFAYGGVGDTAGNDNLNTDGNSVVNTGASITPETFTVDKEKPFGADIRMDKKFWVKIGEMLTFGFWKSGNVTVGMSAEDAITDVVIHYYETSETEVLTEEQLEDLEDEAWVLYEGEFVREPNKQRVFYLKINDYAGNYIYACSNGVILDSVAPEVEIEIKTAASGVHKVENGTDIPVYNGDVTLTVNVNDPMPYAGIKTISYEVTCGQDITQSGELFGFTETNPVYGSLQQNWNSETENNNIVVNASQNNSCDVKVKVLVEDNAGNQSSSEVSLDIDVTNPFIEVNYDNNDPYKVVQEETDEHGYYPADRKATVVITERSAHFSESDAIDAIQITATNAKGETVVSDYKTLISRWDHTEVESDPNADTHTAEISFSQDANYTFAISYRDTAANLNASKEGQTGFVDVKESQTPYSFTVDKVKPTGTISVGTLGKWDYLVSGLTYGLWSKTTVAVSGTSTDEISPIESISYYKTSDTKALTETDLNRLTTWNKLENLTSTDTYNVFDVAANDQFVVYLRLVDCAGNTRYISTDGIIVDDVAPVFESDAPEVTMTLPTMTNGIYDGDVRVGIQVQDPGRADSGDAYSGIKEIRYEVYNLGDRTQSGVLYRFDQQKPTQGQLLQNWSGSITVEAAKNNSNDVQIRLYAVDNAGNEYQEKGMNYAAANIRIDTTAPEISVTYDNNNGDTAFAERTYFRENRTATIRVRERNFDADRVLLTLANTDGIVPQLSDWSRIAGTEDNGDDTIYMATLVYSADGDYTFDISCRDLVENDSTATDYADSLAPQSFTLDKTLPVVTVAYDNNDVQNDNYYKEKRSAIITVTEHNFDESRVQLFLSATDNGNPKDVPAISGWTNNGDEHTATIDYTDDAMYSFDFDYTDKAGNQAADMQEQVFYVDNTDPEVTISNIVDQSANNDEGNIGFVITAKDTNFDVFIPVLTAVVRNGSEFETKELQLGTISDIANGKEYTVTNLDSDGIYRITCTVIDKAGRAYSAVNLTDKEGNAYTEQRAGEDILATFSVNRDGSTFALGSESESNTYTSKLVRQYYVQNVTNDVKIVEINTDPLKEYGVTLNGAALSEGTDYEVEQDGGSENWMKYTYTINKEIFENEGEYNLVVSSKDKADNDAFSDMKDASIGFVVDRTAPVVTVSGLVTDGRYQTDRQVVTVIPTDDGGALNSLEVRLVDRDGGLLKELMNLSGENLVEELENGAGALKFELGEGLYQNVQIICKDCAVDEQGNTNIYDEIFENASVSSSGFMMFWANKPLRYTAIGVTSGGVAAGGLGFTFKFRRRRLIK